MVEEAPEEEEAAVRAQDSRADLRHGFCPPLTAMMGHVAGADGFDVEWGGQEEGKAQ